MSEIESSTITATGAAVVCDAAAEYCRCAKPAGHVVAGDPIHACPPDECTAEWTGDFGTDGWHPVTMPSRVTA